MSQTITHRPAARWAEWYSPELAGAVVGGGAALWLYPPAALVTTGIAGALIGAQELHRAACNGRARILQRLDAARRERDNRGTVAAESAEQREEVTS